MHALAHVGPRWIIHGAPTAVATQAAAARSRGQSVMVGSWLRRTHQADRTAALRHVPMHDAEFSAHRAHYPTHARSLACTHAVSDPSRVRGALRHATPRSQDQCDRPHQKHRHDGDGLRFFRFDRHFALFCLGDCARAGGLGALQHLEAEKHVILAFKVERTGPLCQL